MGKFIVSTRKNGKFQFNLQANNGQVILTSEGYSSKAACMNGIASVRRNAVEAKRFEKKKSKNGKEFFNLKAANGKVIGSSEMYESASSMENGISSVKTNAPAAKVVEM